MNAFVAYLVVNDRHLERFAVSLWTLRQWWSGKVLVLANRPEDVARLAAVAGVDVVPFPVDRMARKSDVYLVKSRIGKSLPVGDCLFLDADTTVHGDLSLPFGVIQNYSVGLTWFSDWVTTGSIMRSRIEKWSNVEDPRVCQAVRDSLAVPLAAINTGVFAVRAGSWFWAEWERVTALRPGFICDEIAAQLICAMRPAEIAILPESLNCSAKFGRSAKPIVRHYHGGSHADHPVWLECRRLAKEAGYVY